METGVMVLELPYLPHKDVSGNSRAGNFAQYRLRRAMKREIGFLVKDDAGRRAWAKLPVWECAELVEVHFLFVLPNNRRRDEDNIITGTKAWKDGLVQAGVVVDDDYKHMRVRYDFTVDRKRGPRTVLTVRVIAKEDSSDERKQR